MCMLNVILIQELFLKTEEEIFFYLLGYQFEKSFTPYIKWKNKVSIIAIFFKGAHTLQNDLNLGIAQNCLEHFFIEGGNCMIFFYRVLCDFPAVHWILS